MEKEKIGLYIHIPFCKKICNYCDFPKRVSSIENQEKYIKALIKELDCVIPLLNKYSIKSIYIGGGTPSSVPNYLLRSLLSSIAQKLVLDEVDEFSIEANPEDIDDEFVKTIIENKINRLSIGVQSFNSNVQKIINRKSDYLDLKNKFNLLHQHNFTNINLDYMYNILDLNNEELIKDLDLFISLNPTHISAYSLILEEKTVLHNLFLKNQYNLLDPDKEADSYYLIQNHLEKNGYIQYEISNFCQKNHESIHNIIYWSNERYLGIGLSGSSYLENYRFSNSSTLSEYLNYVELLDDITSVESLIDKTSYKENIDSKEEVEYQIITNLRMTKGIDLKNFSKRFGYEFISYNPTSIKWLVDNSYCTLTNDEFYINKNYLYLSNQIINKILDK